MRPLRLSLKLDVGSIRPTNLEAGNNGGEKEACCPGIKTP